MKKTQKLRSMIYCVPSQICSLSFKCVIEIKRYLEDAFTKNNDNFIINQLPAAKQCIKSLVNKLKINQKLKHVYLIIIRI